MRLLFILTSPAPGGAETLVKNLCGAFAEQGHDCHVAFATNAATVGNPPEYEARLLAEMADKGIGYSLLTRQRRSLFKAAWKLRKLVRAFRPDLAHVQMISGLLPLRLAASRLPIIYTHHSMSENMAPLAFRLLGRPADHYVAVGEASRRVLQRHFSGPIAMIRNGVPADFAAGEGRTGPSETPNVLSVGTLGPLKDYGTLIEAAGLVVLRFEALGRKVRFAIAGGGTERDRLQQAIEDRALSSHFELLGARADVPSLMREADLLVNSSISEGLPITLIEAAMSALPIVATAVGGNPELVEDGANGFLVPPRRPDLLADRIFETLEDASRYAAFSKRSAIVAQAFTMEECVAAHLALYSQILARRSLSTTRSE